MNNNNTSNSNSSSNSSSNSNNNSNNSLNWRIEIFNLLDTLHNSAKEANYNEYFNCYSSFGCFIGTDSKEYWTIEEFKLFCIPHFKKKPAWIYIPNNERRFLYPYYQNNNNNNNNITNSESNSESNLKNNNINEEDKNDNISSISTNISIIDINDNNNNRPVMVSFDELLLCKSFNCDARGSGTIIWNTENNKWEILSYYLSFPIPDSVGNSVARIIGNFLSTKVNLEEMKKLEDDAEAAANALLAELDLEDSKKGSKKSKSKSQQSNKKKNKGKR